MIGFQSELIASWKLLYTYCLFSSQVFPCVNGLDLTSLECRARVDLDMLEAVLIDLPAMNSLVTIGRGNCDFHLSPSISKDLMSLINNIMNYTF